MKMQRIFIRRSRQRYWLLPPLVMLLAAMPV